MNYKGKMCETELHVCTSTMYRDVCEVPGHGRDHIV
jgi:hypothetical protein